MISRSVNHQAQPLDRHGRVITVALEEQTTMQTLWYWLTELAEVYARHAGRHGPNRLLPAEVLPAHGRVPGHAEPSSQDAGPNGCMAEHAAPPDTADDRPVTGV
jgi:hypothetical protein